MTRGRISLYLDLETYEEMARMLRIRSALVNQKTSGSLARIYSNRLVGFSRTMQIRKKSTSAKSVTRSLLSAGLRPVPGNFLVHVETFTPQRLTTRLTTMASTRLLDSVTSQIRQKFSLKPSWGESDEKTRS